MFAFLGSDDLELADLDELRPLEHELIGQYFTEFKGTYYQPVAGLEELHLFTEDSKVRQRQVEIYEMQMQMKKEKNIV